MPNGNGGWTPPQSDLQETKTGWTPPKSDVIEEPVKKKEPTPEEKPVQSSGGSQTVSSQGGGQQQKSGEDIKTPTTYQWSSGSEQNYGISTPSEKEQRKSVSKNTSSIYYEKLEKKNDVYDKAQNESEVVSIVNYYPFYGDIDRIRKRLNEIGEPKTNEQIQEHNKLVSEYNTIRDTPISQYEQQENGNTVNVPDGSGGLKTMQLIKDLGAFRKELRQSKPELSGAKTVGELLDAQGKSIDAFNALVPEMKTASGELDSAIKDYQKISGYTDKDMGFWEAFSHSAIRSLDNMRLYAMSEGEQASEMKRMELEDELTPKEASGVLGSLGEIAGGLTPFITLGALTGNIGGLAGFGITSLTQGMAGGSESGGRSLYDTYRELKESGVNEQEALRTAHKISNFNAAASGIAFGSLGLFGGEGIGSVASRAIYEGLGGQVAKKTAIKQVVNKLKDQSIAPLIFGSNRGLQNLYSNYEGVHRDLDEGVIQDMMFPVALHASMAALAGGVKFVGKIGKESYNTYTTFVAQNNPQSLQYILNEAVKSGVIDEAYAQKVASDVQGKAEVIAQMPPMPFNKLQDGIPAMQNWLLAKRQLDKAKKDGSPFLSQAESLEREAAKKVQETLGTPLSPKEQSAYEELISRKKESEKNKEAQGLSKSEREELSHYENRLTHYDRVENIPQEKPFRVKSKNGETGLLIKNEEGDMEFIPDGNKPSKVFERNEATPKKTIQELGFTRIVEESIEKPKSQILTGEVKEGADVLFGGRRYTLTGMVKDADGKIIKVKLLHKNGDKRTISDRSAEGKKLISDVNKMIGKADKEEPIKRQQEEKAAESEVATEQTKPTEDDTENITGVSGEIGKGQEPIETKPDETGGGKVEGGGLLEKAQEVATKEGNDVGKQQVPDGKGTWRKKFNEEKDIATKNQILEAIADSNTSTDKELMDVYEAAKKTETVTNRINWALANNKNTPKEVFDDIINSKVLEKTVSDEAIKKLIDKRNAQTTEEAGKEVGAKKVAKPSEETAIFAELNNARSQVAREKAFSKFQKMENKARDVYENFDGYLKEFKRLKEEGKIEFETDC